MAEKGRGDRVAPFGQGSEGGPQAGGRAQATRAGLGDASERPVERASPPPRSGAQCTDGPARRGSRGGRQWGTRAALRAGLPQFRRSRGSEATRQPHSPARLAPNLGFVLRTSETRDPLGILPLREAEKLPGVGREAGQAAAWGPGSGSRPSRRCAGDGVVRKPQPRAARRGSPRPPCKRHRGSAELRRGPRPDRVQRKPTSSPLPSQARGRGPPQYFRTVILEQPSPSWRSIRLRGQRLETVANSLSLCIST